MDDEQLVRNVAGALIRALGHDVESVESGEEAVRSYLAAAAAGRPFDVVILDLTVRGGMGGRETLRRLLEIAPEVKAVVSSGYAADGVIADYRLHGFCAALAKPYTMAGLRDVLDGILG